MIRNVLGQLFLLCLVPVLMLGSTDGMKYQGSAIMHPDTSAPDAWGYTWVRSTDPGGPTFQWVDITTRGTLVGGLTDDNVVGPFDMLFSYSYYWYSHNRFKIGSNGYIQFDNSTTAFAPPFAAHPNVGLPNDLMSICVGDLVFSGQAGAAGQCYYWTNGNDSLVVSFLNVTEWDATIIPANTHTFQIILNKTDSTITYQYGPQRGRYNSTNNTRLVIGIENSTGQYGLSYAFSTTPPHALMPDSGLAIKIKRTVNTGLQVTDAGVVGGLNATNLGEMMLVGTAKTIQCVVKNYGTAAITNAPVRYAITKTGQPSAFDTVIVPALASGEQVTVTFARQFTPAVTSSYSALFNITVPSDIGAGNNNKTAEITSSSFSSAQNTTVLYEAGVAASYINWIGGGGMGVAFDLPVYPVRIESVYVSVGLVTVQPMTVEIFDGSSGSPGTVLATRTVSTTIVGMNGVDFRSDSIRITAGRFFVGARGQLGFNYETVAPISYRSWEYTGGWAPYRTGDLQDVIIRASVRYEPSTVSIGVPISAGWNLISSPVTNPIPGDSVRQLYPTSLNPYAFEFSGGYVQRYTLANGKGYWEKFPGAISQPVTGTPRTLDSISVAAGWNIVGSISCTVDTGTIVSVPPGLRASSWFKYAAGYTPTTQITAGGGYWVKANGAGKFVLVCPPLGVPKAQTSGMGDVLNSMTIADSKGGLQTLYFGADETIPVSLYAMPPLPPAGAFDARFETSEGGSMVQTHGGEGAEFTVAIQSDAYPVTVTWNVKDASYELTAGAGSVQSMRGEGTMKISNSEVNRLFLKLTGNGQLPKEYALSQNYPNPFNPTTTIKYDLPVDTRVLLKVFNVIGQEVATLVNEEQKAGYRSIEWNANNFASGVYLYRFEAGNFTSVKKLLLVK